MYLYVLTVLICPCAYFGNLQIHKSANINKTPRFLKEKPLYQQSEEQQFKPENIEVI